MAVHDVAALRQCALAVCVLEDIDLAPGDAGVRVGDRRGPLVTWAEMAEAVGSQPPTAADSRRRVSALLRLRGLVAELGRRAAPVFGNAARLVALPPGHIEHPGPRWVREQQPGGALDLGLGVLGLLDDPDEVLVLPPAIDAVLDAGDDWWPRVRQHTETMGGLAAERLARDGIGEDLGSPRSVLRPVGGCDALSLLASARLRRFIAGGDGSGMRAVAVPDRSRAWFDLARIDPAFVAAAWTATSERDRGVRSPLLVTADEVGLSVQTPNVVRQSLEP